MSTDWVSIKTRPIPFAPGYIADVMGRIIRLHGSGPYPEDLRLPKLQEDACGYLKFSYGHRNCRKMALVHRAVIAAFTGHVKPGMVVRHMNSNPKDNRLVNLRWGTQKQNLNDLSTKRRRRMASGEYHPLSRLQKEDIAEIREISLKHNHTIDIRKRLAAKYGYTLSGISAIISKRTWRNV